MASERKITDLPDLISELSPEDRALANRIFDVSATTGRLDPQIAATEGDPFCHPKEGTPADVFGRVEGEHAITASNVAKYDGFHGVIVFEDHNPLHLTPEKVAGYVSVGLEWSRRVLEADPEAH